MGSAVNSLIGGNGGLLGAVGGIVGEMFGGPIGEMIGEAVGSLLQQAIGSAIQQAISQLTSEHGMPKFVGDLAKQVASQEMGKLGGADVPAEAMQAAQDHFGGAISQIGHSMVQDIVNQTLAAEHGKKAKGAASWLEALAEALGAALDKQAAKVSDLAGQITDSNANDKPSTMTQLTTESQRLSFMMNSVDQTIKTIGESLSTAARKG